MALDKELLLLFRKSNRPPIESSRLVNEEDADEDSELVTDRRSTDAELLVTAVSLGETIELLPFGRVAC